MYLTIWTKFFISLLKTLQKHCEPSFSDCWVKKTVQTIDDFSFLNFMLTLFYSKIYQSNIVEATIPSQFPLLPVFSRRILIIVKCGRVKTQTNKWKAKRTFSITLSRAWQTAKNHSVVERKKSCEDKKSCIFYDYDTDLCQ